MAVLAVDATPGSEQLPQPYATGLRRPQLTTPLSGLRARWLGWRRDWRQQQTRLKLATDAQAQENHAASMIVGEHDLCSGMKPASSQRAA